MTTCVDIFPTEKTDIEAYPTVSREETQTTIKIDGLKIFMTDDRAEELAEMILKTIGDKDA